MEYWKLIFSDETILQPFSLTFFFSPSIYVNKWNTRKGYVSHNQVSHSKNNFASTPFPLHIIPVPSFQKPLSTNSKFLSNFNYTLDSSNSTEILSFLYLKKREEKKFFHKKVADRLIRSTRRGGDSEEIEKKQKEGKKREDDFNRGGNDPNGRGPAGSRG